MTEIRVAIVDDNRPFRQGLAATLGFHVGFACVCSCGSAAEALRTIPSLKADVVLMDINLGAASGIDCVADLRERLPGINVIMLTISDDADSVFKSLQAGASGYLVKDVTPARLFEAIAEVHVGGSPMSSRIARLLVREFQAAPASPPETRLSQREHEIVQLLAKGYRDKEIADQLKIAVSTVLTHVRNIYRKLEVRSRAEAVARVGNSARTARAPGPV